MKRLMIISYCVVVAGLWIYLSESRAPGAMKAIDIPLHVIFLTTGVLIIATPRLDRRAKTGLIVLLTAIATTIGVLLVSPMIGPNIPLDVVSWIFATAAFTIELLLYLAVVFAIDAAWRWITRRIHPASASG